MLVGYVIAAGGCRQATAATPLCQHVQAHKLAWCKIQVYSMAACTEGVTLYHRAGPCNLAGLQAIHNQL
jgi:hypothetical protein